MQGQNQLARTSLAFVALAALCWGLSGGIGAILLAKGWGAFLVSFYRGAIGLLFVIVWLVLHPHGNGLANRRLWFWSVLAGLGIAGNFIFYFVSIAEGSVAVAATLMYCAPVFVYLVSFGLKLESPTPPKWTAIAVVIIGIVLLTGIYDVGASDVTPVAIGSGLLAGLSYGVFLFGFKYATRHGSPQGILAIAFAVLTVILIWPSDVSQAIAVMYNPDWSLFITLGVLGAGLSFIFYIVGMYQAAPTVISIVAMIEPVTAALFSVVILNESLDSLQLIGMGLILIAVTELSIYSNVRRPLSNRNHRSTMSRHR